MGALSCSQALHGGHLRTLCSFGGQRSWMCTSVGGLLDEMMDERFIHFDVRVLCID